MKFMKRWNILNSRIIALCQQGWHSAAVSLAEETLEFAEKAFGCDHPNVAESLNNLALIYYTQGKEAEASIAEQTGTRSENRAMPAGSPQYMNKVVLLNLARRKYALAESLFRQALQIKKNALGQGNSELSQVMRNLADLHNAQGKNTEAEPCLEPPRLQCNKVWQTFQMSDSEADNHDSTEIRHKLECMRCSGNFPAKLANKKTGVSIDGVTENISQVGAFIKTRNWSAFRTNDPVSVAISLPSILSDQIANVDMEGPAIIAGVDEDNEGIAIQFMRSFRQFERVGETEVAGKIRYKKIAQYIKTSEDTSLSKFLDMYPNGFLVEKFRMDFDSDVIFQFSTKQIDVPRVLDELSYDLADKDFLHARVIEISKKKIKNNEGVINIGRSANNDIVLYNKAVSKSHAFLYLSPDDGVAHLADLQSTNGTFLNNEKITPYMMYQLRDGVEISFGPQTKVVYLSTKTFYDFLTSLKQAKESHMDA